MNNEERKQERSYEIAIDAYWQHIKRYHTWMNYFALFDGALLVAFCTLMCATNIIIGDMGKCVNAHLFLQGNGLYLTNDYWALQYIIVALGIITSVFWLLSIKGHRAWKVNWMNVIEYYESKDLPIYSLVILDKKYDFRNKSGTILPKGIIPQGYSTDKITVMFIYMVILAWILAFFYVCGWRNLSCYMVASLTYLLIIIILHTIHLYRICDSISHFLLQLFYSDVSMKVIKYKTK